MFSEIPADPQIWMKWTWKDFEPYDAELASTELSADNLEEWLQAWSSFAETVDEVYNRLYAAITANTADAQIKERYDAFLDHIYPAALQSEQNLKKKLLESRLEPAGFEVTLRNMRAEADLFREANLPLLSEEQKLNSEFDKIVGAETVEWEGKELTLTQLLPIYNETDRTRREKAWRLSLGRQLADREAINRLWVQLLDLRLKLAGNAGKPNYRAYRWQNLLRFDYTPEDCLRFHKAIEEAVVPAASRIYARRRQRLGVENLRPWDLNVDPMGRAPLAPYKDPQELITKTGHVFDHVDPVLGEHFRTMVAGGLLDVENRKNKAPGAYCTTFARSRLPYIHLNAVGIHLDVATMLHESGHAFHVFETNTLPYFHQRATTAEFAEVASMGMELLASPYLDERAGGFYSPADTSRARIEQLESIILFWPYMAVVDAFQHWVYMHPADAHDSHACDARWAELWRRFMPGVDWSGLEEFMETGWHRKLHIHTAPFYYVEYGLAELGAVQIWRNSLEDAPAAVAAYRSALALGGTEPLPELFRRAGARLAFDTHTLQTAVQLMENTILKLDQELEEAV